MPPISSTAALATAAPARSISTSTGSGAALSIAAISSGVTTGRTAYPAPNASVTARQRVSVADSASAGVAASTITRITGSVPLALISTRPPSPSSSLTAAMAAASPSSPSTGPT